MVKRKYTSRSPRNIKEQYLDDISFANSQQIDISSLSNQSLVDVITVSQTPQEVKVGAEPLKDRHSIEIYNDSSFLVYFGFSPTMTVGQDALLINSGSSVTININPNKTVRVYVVAPDLDVEIKIVEIS